MSAHEARHAWTCSWACGQDTEWTTKGAEWDVGEKKRRVDTPLLLADAMARLDTVIFAAPPPTPNLMRALRECKLRRPSSARVHAGCQKSRAGVGRVGIFQRVPWSWLGRGAVDTNPWVSGPSRHLISGRSTVLEHDEMERETAGPLDGIPSDVAGPTTSVGAGFGRSLASTKVT